MTDHTLLTWWGRRIAGDDRERGSLPFLMLVIVISAGLGAVLLSTVISQTRTSSYDEGRIRSVDAAQAGLDMVLATIRSAVKTDGTTGDAGKLPCGGSPWQDQMVNTATSTRFNAKVRYFLANPATLSETARASSAMTCSPSVGTYGQAADGSTTRAPRFALIESTGWDTTRLSVARARSLETVYVFTTNDVTVSGGQIRIYPSGAQQYCMDAGSNPVVDGPVSIERCSTTSPPAEQQVWSYRADLSIELVSSIPGAGQVGLCIGTKPAAHSAGIPVVLKQCAVADENPQKPNDTFVCPIGFTPSTFRDKYPSRSCAVSPYSQRWSVDDSAHLRGATTGNDNTDGFCLDVNAQTAGTVLLLQPCAGSVTDTRQTWVPSPTVGAGNAGAGNSQLVNYAGFATCVDVTDANPATGYLILYTCKQNPSAANVLWNQKLTPSTTLAKTSAPTAVQLRTTTGGKTYCLKSPLVTSTVATPTYPRLEVCPTTSTPTDAFTWTVAQSTSASGGALAYRERYTVKDSGGRCLAPGSNTNLHNGQYSKVVVADCDGSTSQKWNADPSVLGGTVTNTRELRAQ